MSARDLAAAVLLCTSVAGVFVPCVGAWRSAGPLDAQHFVSAASTVPPVLLAAAVVVAEGFSSGAVLTILTAAVVVVTSSATATAFGRAVTAEQGPGEASTDEGDG